MSTHVEGLKMLRFGARTATPQYHCSNCRCNRYSPCHCMVSKGRKIPTERLIPKRIK